MLRLTRHARDMIELRRIDLVCIEAAIASPDSTMADPAQPGVTRSYKAIAAARGRILRVVHRAADADVLVITAHFDRDAVL